MRGAGRSLHRALCRRPAGGRLPPRDGMARCWASMPRTSMPARGTASGRGAAHGMVRTIEGALLPRCRHLTAAAPLIGDAYAAHYGVRARRRCSMSFRSHGADAAAIAATAGRDRCRAYWFSQTIGLDRGLQPFIQAMARTRTRVTLDIRGGNPLGPWRAADGAGARARHRRPGHAAAHGAARGDGEAGRAL